MPIPLNIVAGFLRGVWLWFLRGGVAVPTQSAEAYEAGYRAGIARAHGFYSD